jgi:hypothetical protein
MGEQFVRRPFHFDGEDLILFRHRGPFEVDGIVYEWSPYVVESSVDTIRPMIMVVDDDDPCDDDEDRARMFHSDPPTEAELDLYVHERILPAT